MDNNILNRSQATDVLNNSELYHSREGSLMDDKSPVKGGTPGKNIMLNQNATINYHPFKGPKLHLYKKGASRRIKTSSATRNL